MCKQISQDITYWEKFLGMREMQVFEKIPIGPVSFFCKYDYEYSYLIPQKYNLLLDWNVGYHKIKILMELK